MYRWTTFLIQQAFCC